MPFAASIGSCAIRCRAMLKPSKRGRVVTIALFAINLIAQGLLTGLHAWRDEQLAAAIHWLHRWYGAGWLAVYMAWAVDNTSSAVLIGTCILIAGLYVVTFMHDRILATRVANLSSDISEQSTQPNKSDVSLQISVNDDQDDRQVFVFENYGGDPAFSATGKVALNGTDYLEFKAEREVLRSRPVPAFVYIVRDSRRELVRGHELAGVLRNADIEVARELGNMERQMFAAGGIGEVEFAVSTSFVDRNHVPRIRQNSHRLIFDRGERRAVKACRFEPISIHS